MMNRNKMNARYYVAIKPQTNEFHTVHREGCPFLPDDKKRILLGTFVSGKDAVREGLGYFLRTNTCRFCIKDHEPEEKETAFSEIELKGFVPLGSQILNSREDALCYFLS